MAVNVNETETKYDAPADGSVPKLDGLPRVAVTATPDEVELEAEYYDTADLRLLRAGITLRRRRGGDDAGWHLKLPLGGDTRREVRLPPGPAGDAVPGELADLVRVHARREPLRPVARLTTRRRRLILLDEAGESLAEVADDDVCARTLGETTTSSRWHEVEVELTGGDQQLLKDADELLRGDTERLAAELKWLGTVLGEARDAEVLAVYLLAGLRDAPAEQVVGPVRARVQGHFASVRAAALTELLAALGSERYFSLLDQLDSLMAGPPFTPQAAEPAAGVLPPAARRAYKRAAQRMRRARRAPAGRARDVSLHQARKAVRRARYVSEAMAPVVGKRARRFVGQMKKVQSVLGDHQDAVIARTVERELGMSAHLAGENAFSYGLLAGRAACHNERLQAQARRTWTRASRSRNRRWMG